MTTESNNPGSPVVEQEMECLCADDQPDLVPWLEETMEQENPDDCRPCAFSVLTAEYQGFLIEAGRDDLSQRIADRVADTSTQEEQQIMLQTAEEMDIIKREVPEALREHLCELDALAHETANELSYDEQNADEQE